MSNEEQPPSTVTSISNPERDKLQAQYEFRKRYFDLIILEVELTAKIRWKAYQIYKAQGFNDQQALELCVK